MQAFLIQASSRSQRRLLAAASHKLFEYVLAVAFLSVLAIFTFSGLHATIASAFSNIESRLGSDF